MPLLLLSKVNNAQFLKTPQHRVLWMGFIGKRYLKNGYL